MKIELLCDLNIFGRRILKKGSQYTVQELGIVLFDYLKSRNAITMVGKDEFMIRTRYLINGREVFNPTKKYSVADCGTLHRDLLIDASWVYHLAQEVEVKESIVKADTPSTALKATARKGNKRKYGNVKKS